MKIKKMQDLIDNIAFVILLIVPFMICFIVYAIEKLVKVVVKKDIHFIDFED